MSLYTYICFDGNMREEIIFLISSHSFCISLRFTFPVIVIIVSNGLLSLYTKLLYFHVNTSNKYFLSKFVKIIYLSMQMNFHFNIMQQLQYYMYLSL